MPAFQSFPRRTAQLQSSISLALRKGSGFTSATQVLCTLRNEGCIMCFKGRGFHKTKTKNKQTKPNKTLPPKNQPTNNKQKTKQTTTTTKKTGSGQEVFGNVVNPSIPVLNESWEEVNCRPALSLLSPSAQGQKQQMKDKELFSQEIKK